MNAVAEEKQVSATTQKIIEIEAGFRKVETWLMAARNFLAAHADKLEGIDFRCWGWTEEIVFQTWGEVRDPKEMARRFGADGWKREADQHSCGAIHWVKVVDGVRLKVENAERVKPQINETVRL